MKHHDTVTRYRGEIEAQLQRAVQKMRAIKRFSSDDCEPCKVAQGLYIGSIGAARNLQSLQKEGITHVLNASPIVPCFHRRLLQYKVLNVYDDAQEDISQFFSEANRYIAKGRRKGGILVHCFAGMSRSATLVVAYLIACERMTLSEAMGSARTARPCISPNLGFMAQLERYSSEQGLSVALVQCTLFSLPTPKLPNVASQPQQQTLAMQDGS